MQRNSGIPVHPDAGGGLSSAPLAERMRPSSLDEFVGQMDLVGAGGPLRQSLESGHLYSFILWGPPGSGKTTLARLVAAETDAAFYQLNAVAAGVRDVKAIIEEARQTKEALKRKSILFIDEIHRFNKAQQDVLLSSVENGIIYLIGATTENPSFEIIGPLLSRCQVYRIDSLSFEELRVILDRALSSDPLLKSIAVTLPQESAEILISYSNGDARVLLNALEFAARTVRTDKEGKRTLTSRHIENTIRAKAALYDKKGDYHYDMISAFIKSVRGSDPDAAVYWMARILDGGEDPKFIARRLIILASEDIGNADPYAVTLATSVFTAVTYVGMPEAAIILAQGATYLASAPKSNASYMALRNAQQDLHSGSADAVPLHLRNAPTSLMKNAGYGKDYKYPHDEPGNFIEENYLPERLKNRVYYFPTENGGERKIRERLAAWWGNSKRTKK